MTNRAFVQKFQRDPSISRKHGNLSCYGGVLYSYGWYPIAKKFKGFWIVPEDGYSSSTRRHISYINHGISVPDMRREDLGIPQALQLEAPVSIVDFSNKIRRQHYLLSLAAQFGIEATANLDDSFVSQWVSRTKGTRSLSRFMGMIDDLSDDIIITFLQRLHKLPTPHIDYYTYWNGSFYYGKTQVIKIWIHRIETYGIQSATACLKKWLVYSAMS